jgi:REP element-mobilizing transposase RayT
MAKAASVLDSRGRSVVELAIRDHCRIRGWALLALSVRTTHVHVVVNCHGRASPEKAMAEFKSWGTRRLVAAGRAAKGERLWTDHGSTRWINHGNGLMLAVGYVTNGQDSAERFEQEAREQKTLAELLTRMAELEREATEIREGMQTPSARAEGSSSQSSSV